MYAHMRKILDKASIYDREARKSIMKFIYQSVSQQPSRFELLKNYDKNPPVHDLLQGLDIPLMLQQKDKSLRKVANQVCDLIESHS